MSSEQRVLQHSAFEVQERDKWLQNGQILQDTLKTGHGQRATMYEMNKLQAVGGMKGRLESISAPLV